MTKNDVIAEHMTLPIAVQVGTERVLGNHHGSTRDIGQDYQEQRDYQMKVELPSFNGNVSIEEYLDWISEVEKFFDYIYIADDKKMCLVAYELKRGASV
ncbi:hypothetical protein ACB092_11G210400 [Castanea dentata]